MVKNRDMIGKSADDFIAGGTTNTRAIPLSDDETVTGPTLWSGLYFKQLVQLDDLKKCGDLFI